MSIAQLEQEIATLKASLGALEAAKNAALQEIRRLGEEKAELRAASQRQLAGGDTAGHAALRSQEARLDEVIGEAYSGPAFKNLEAAESKIRSLESQLYQAQQKAKFEAEKNTPVVKEPAPVPPEDTGTVPPGGASNVNPPPLTAPGTSPPAAPPKAAPEPPTQNQGATASGSQGPANTSPGANTSGNLNADDVIEPRPNVLDRFASYTYSASVYLMSTLQYERLLRSKKKNINGYNLLFQSAGAPTNVGGPMGKEAVQKMIDAEGPVTDYGRNPAFPQDFYIDSITIDNALPGRQTQAAHMVTNMKFTVIEPGNISLLDRLYAAVQDMGQTAGENQPINYTATAYLMVIRWYGYDENGKLVAGRTAPDPKTGLTDTNAIVEKFIPFIIKKINWSVGSKLVSYEFDCAPINQMVAGGTRRGTVPYDIQLTATSVGELLGGNAAYSSANAPASAPGAKTTNKTDAATRENNALAAAGAAYPPSKANAAKDRKIIKLGLMGAMTEFQQRLVTDKIYRKADTYEIVFVPGRDGKQNIRDAQIRLPGDPVAQDQTGMGTAASKNAVQAFSPETNALNISSRNWSVTAGMQVVQAIDLAIRNSSYIYDQALTTYNEQAGTESLNSARTKPLQWFKINMEAEQGEYDNLRNDYAYKIRFIISEYEVPNFDSKYFPVSKFRGVHKSYPFWFTGQNTAVLDYQANFNGLYNITVTGETPNDSFAAKIREQYTSSMREIPKYTYMSASSESQQGAEMANKIPANASEVLYSPGDMGRTKVRIIGDPGWIQQGDLAGGVSVTEFSYSPFLPDGTINFDANQVLFEISWQRPQDYNIATGLADPYKGAGLEARLPLQSTVYLATKVISEFRQGKFEQTIEGSLFMFPKPDGTNTAAATAVNNQSNAETARLAAEAAKAARNQAAADNNALAAAGATLGTAAAQSRVNAIPRNGSAGGGRGSTDAYAAVPPGGAGSGQGFVNQLANGARAAAGLPAPNTNSASAPPPPPPPGFPIGPLPPARAPTSNGVIVGPAAQILGPTIQGQLRRLDRQNSAREN